MMRPPSPSELMAQALKQASVSLTVGVFIGSALTSGIAVGVAAAWVANGRVLPRLCFQALDAVSAVKDVALSTREGRALHRALLQSVGVDARDEACAAPPAADLSQPISSFDDPRLAWANGEPSSSTLAEGGRALTVEPTPGLDYWCRTFYTPLLVKTDGQSLVASVAADEEATIETAFTLSPAAQFDQAGAMVLVDDRTWCKAGIEFVDGVPRLACVVTNDGYSDWSTSKWADWDPASGLVAARVRVSKLQPGEQQGGCLVIEASPLPLTRDVAAPGGWVQVRIASLRPSARQACWRMGVYSQSPVVQRGCSAKFHYISLGPKGEVVHEAALPDGHGGLPSK